MNSHGQLVKSGSAGATASELLKAKITPKEADMISKYFKGSVMTLQQERIERSNAVLALTSMSAMASVQLYLNEKELKKLGLQERRITPALVARRAKPLLEEGHDARKRNTEKNSQVTEDIATLAQQALPMGGLKAFLESNTITFEVKISNGAGAPSTSYAMMIPVNDETMYACTFTNYERGDAHGHFNIPPIMRTEVKVGSLEIDIPGKAVLVGRPGKQIANYGTNFAAALMDFLDIFKSFVPKA